MKPRAQTEPAQFFESAPSARLSVSARSSPLLGFLVSGRAARDTPLGPSPLRFEVGRSARGTGRIPPRDGVWPQPLRLSREGHVRDPTSSDTGWGGLPRNTSEGARDTQRSAQATAPSLKAVAGVPYSRNVVAATLPPVVLGGAIAV
ncbi:hypothetical protein MTO96_002930 [Rhipicephalus appendiculatus]